MIQNFVSPEEIIIRLKKLIKKLEQLQTHMKQSGITPAQARIIFPIAKNNVGYTMQELTELAGVDKALVSRAIADLETKGIVERDKQDDNERRNYKIILSAKGKALILEHHRKHKEKFVHWKEKFTEAEIKIFANMLNRLVE